MSSAFTRERGSFISLALTLLVLGVIGTVGTHFGYSGWKLVVTLVALGWLLEIYFLLGLVEGDDLWPHSLSGWSSVVPVALLLVLPYLLYGIGTESLELSSFLKLLSYALVPLSLLAFSPKKGPRLTWLDGLAIVALWFPLEFQWLSDVWTWPRPQISNIFNTLLAVNTGVIGFIIFRKLDGIGYRFKPRWLDVKAAVVSLLLFLSVGIPFGIALDFIAFHRRLSPPSVLGLAVGLFLVTGIPEELLFRGIIQNLMTKTIGNRWLALVLASLIFGVAHLNNGDWRFFCLASLAGVFYGWAYQRTEGLLAPALAHACVDAIWSGYLRH